MYGGKTCPGKPVETKECNVQPCPPPKSKYNDVILQAMGDQKMDYAIL